MHINNQISSNLPISIIKKKKNEINPKIFLNQHATKKSGRILPVYLARVKSH